MIAAWSLRRSFLAETIGTYILVFFGVGSVHAAVLTGAQTGIWQVAIVWGIAIALGIYATGAISGAHMNPAITLAFSAFRQFPIRRVPAYLAAQLLGAILAAATLYLLFDGVLVQFEAANRIVRGQSGSELSAMVYGQYFPNPAIARVMHWPVDCVSPLQAMLAEAIGTAFLAFFIFAVTEPLNTGSPGNRLLPVFIGLTVSVLISVLAPLTQAGFNPARDFGPRLFACFAGWGSVAIPGPHWGFLTVYILGPIAGAMGGAGLYEYVVKPGLKAQPNLGQSTGDSTNRGTTMQSTRLIFVGGFLGAGKTTLLWEAARRLAARGQRVGLITNDQAPNLVDTGLLAQQGFEVREVAGSCFCCNFNAMLDAASALRNGVHADVLIGEPVGSCTDLSATILQPLKDRYRQQFALTPLSVLADPERIRTTLSGETTAMHPDAAYIFRKQLEEADMIVINKVDLLSSSERVALQHLLADQLPGRPVRFISAQTGEGVDEWLEAVLTDHVAGGRITAVDYDRYARGEAVLGWLNATCDLSATGGRVDWHGFCRGLLESFKDEFARRAAAVGHVKIMLSTPQGILAGNLTRSDAEVSVRGRLTGSSPEARLVVNARVEMTPESLEQVVRMTLGQAANRPVAARIDDLRSFSPGRPVPTHRYVSIV